MVILLLLKYFFPDSTRLSNQASGCKGDAAANALESKGIAAAKSCGDLIFMSDLLLVSLMAGERNPNFRS
jgi:hypothetical protein